jgi:uncharacterized protein YkwD
MRPVRGPGIVAAVGYVRKLVAGGLVCAGVWTPAAMACPSRPDAPPTAAAIACAISDVRDRHGLGSLDGSPRLAEAGKGHTADMVRREYFSHTTPGGASFVDRIARTGYLRGANGWCVGEVLAYGSSMTARDVVRAWLDSPPHRRVLLAPAYRRVGVGVRAGLPTGGGDGVTVAAEFGARGGC